MITSFSIHSEKDSIDKIGKENFDEPTNSSSTVKSEEDTTSIRPNPPEEETKDSVVVTNIFEVIYPKSKKRNHDYKERYKKPDLIKDKIATHFFNVYLIRRFTGKIRKAGSVDNFKIFPREFIRKATSKRNKEIWTTTFENIFNNKDSEFYESHFKINYNIIKKLRADGNKHILIESGLDKELETNIRDLYKNYLGSECYKGRISKIFNEFENSYFKKYKTISKNLSINITGYKSKKTFFDFD